ncbi:lipopolysaccharide biosynthesis protein [Methylosinus sp. PW1]|uniref:lipopolysaccharide biosynthesis protein n=1 Tax=Methylosinus sp. PW1 TaxID=107636 RepID=UPI00055F6764|nr:lipopolysaccharide biosynthesis protein [Methylosinus sp. PW1]
MSIRQKFAASSVWFVLGNATNNFVSFLIFVVLARLLDASTIGLVAFALIFIDLGRIVVFGGLPEAMVQRRHWDDDVASVCYTANLIASVVFVILIAGVAAPLVAAYYRAEAGPVLASLAAICFIDAARAVHESKLRREFRYKPLAARMSIATATAGVVGVWLAFQGFGVWSLVVQRLLNAVMLTLLSWRAARWTPRLMLSRPILRELSGFIFHLTPARLLTVVTARVAEFVIALVLGPAAVAYYRVGARGLEAISQLTVAPVQQAALSAFARMPNIEAMGAAYGRVTRASAIFACPVYLGAAVIAPDFVGIVFGPQWAPSGGIMTGLALSIGASTLGYFMQPALTAANRPELVLLSSIGGFFITTATVLASVWHGPEAVAFANTAQQYVALPFRLRLLASALKADWRKLASGPFAAFLASAAMAGSVYALRIYALESLSPAAKLALSALAGAALYPLLLALVARGHVRELIADVAPVLPARLALIFSSGSSGSGENR